MKKITDSRVLSQEGFLLADAVLTKVGDLEYTRGELNMPGDPESRVTLSRTREVIEKALPSMTGAFVTVGHPEEFLGTGNANKEIVGAVVTEPKITHDGRVTAAIKIFDKDAISRVQSGEDQLSPGFNFVPANLDGDRGDISQMSINHVAIVPKGRAGESVRILDHLPSELDDNNKVDILMENQNQNIDNDQLISTINSAVKAAVDEAMAKPVDKDTTDDESRGMIVTAVVDAIKPAMDSINEIKDAQAKAAADAAAQKAADEAESEKRTLIEGVTKAERERFQVIMDAMPHIPTEQHGKLGNMMALDVLKLAVGDSIGDTSNMTVDMLRGILRGREIEQAANAAKAQDEKKVEDAAKPVEPEGLVQKDQVTVGDSEINDFYAERFAKRNGA